MATFVRRVVVGTPIRRVTSGSFSLNNLSGVNISGDAGTGQNIGEGQHNDLLVYDSAASEYRNLNVLRKLNVDYLTFDSNAITVDFNDPAKLNELYINAINGTFFDGRVEADRFNQRQLTVFDDSSLTTKFYVDQEVDKVKEVTFTMDDGFTDSVQIYDGETITLAGGRGLSTRGVKIGQVLTITTDLDSTGADSGTFGSSIRIPVLTTNSRGQITAISDVAVASLDSISYDSSLGSGTFSINTSDGGLFQTDINLNPFTTDDLVEGPGDPQPATESYTLTLSAINNFFYQVSGSDRTGSINSGDPALTIRTDDTITFNNTVSGDHPMYIKTVQGDGTGDQASGVTGQGTATVTWTPTVPGTYYYQCANHTDMYGVLTVTQRPGVPEPNLYYRRTRFDSALGDDISIATIRGYFSTDGDLLYDSASGQFSIDVDQVYSKDNFDSDLDAAMNSNYNLHWYPDSNFFDLTAINDSTAGTYGSPTQMPVFSVDSYGRIDSIGEVLVASVDSTRWISSTNTYRISTGDGQVFNTVIDSFNSNVLIQDDIKLNFGAGEDLKIYHNTGDGTNYIEATNSVLKASSTMYIHLGSETYVEGDLIPWADSTYDLGTSTNKWKDLHLSGNTIHLGQVKLQDSAGSLSIKTASGLPGDLTLKHLTADSAFISQLTVDSINVGQLNLSNADMDSLYVDQLNVSQGDIDSAHISQLDIDSAYATQLNVATADIDTLTSADAILDSAYIGQLNVSQADADSLYVDQLNVVTADIDNVTLGQVTIDSAHATQLDVSNAHIDAATVDSARIENLSVDILNADSVSADFIRFDPILWDDNTKPASDEGTVYYNSGPDALVYKPATASPIKIGQDDVVRVYNNSGAMIPKGTPVYVTGATNDFPTIEKAQANDINTIDETIGVLKDSINNNTFGLVLQRGLLGRLDTSAYAPGTKLFVSADSAGKFTSTAPEYPNFAYEIGTVLVQDSQGGPAVGGCIQIKPFREFFEQIRVTGSGRVDANFTIGGNLTVIGSQVQTSVQSLAVSDTVIEMGAGDTIGLAATNFGGTGTNDASLTGHYTGDGVVEFHVRIDSVGSGGEGDKIEWSYDSQYGSLEPFDSALGSTSFVLSSGDLVANLANGIKIAFTAETGHDLGDSWSGEASPIDVQIGIVGNYNPPADSHAYSGFIRDPSDFRWKLFQQYLPDPQANINFADPSLEYAPLQVGTLYADTVNADLTGNVTGTVTDISNHTTDQLLEGSTNQYYLKSRVDSDILDSIATNNLNVATGDISQFTSDSAFITQLNVSTGDIDTLTSANAILDSAYIGQLNVSQADADSLYVDQLNVTTADIDTLTSADAVLDSAYIGQLNVATGDIDTLTSANASLDSAYVGQLNVTTGDIDTFTSANANIDSAYIGQLNVSQAHIDSLYADNINLTLVDIDTLTADSAVITNISGSTANFTTITRSGATSYNGIWGSASEVPIITLDSSGFVDSIGTTSVAGVTAFAWDSATSTATISTADGGSYPAIINGWGDNQKVYFGADSNAYFYHDGNNFNLENDQGGFRITLNDNGQDFAVYAQTTDALERVITAGGTSEVSIVNLWHNDKKRLLTTSTGVEIRGGNGFQGSLGEILADSATISRLSGSVVVESGLTSDSLQTNLISVTDDSNGDYRIKNNIVQRTYENRDSQNLTAGITQDSNNQGLINIYVRTGFKTGQHRYWKQGSAKGYYIAYDSDHLYTDKEIQAPLLDLLPGVTYRFHHNDSSMSTHDIRFYWDNQKSGLLSDSAADIKYVGTAGNIDVGNSYAQIKVKDDGPRSFGYQCLNHPYMGNLAITNSGAGARILGTSSGIKVDGNIEAIIDGGTY